MTVLALALVGLVLVVAVLCVFSHGGAAVRALDRHLDDWSGEGNTRGGWR